MDKYNIGQQVEFMQDMEVNSGFGDKSTIRKGTKAWVTASKNYPSLYFNGGKEFLLNRDNTELVGYSAKGLAQFIFNYLSIWLPMDDMMEDYEVTEEEFKQKIEEALEELGFFEGNIEKSE